MEDNLNTLYYICVVYKNDTRKDRACFELYKGGTKVKGAVYAAVV